MYKQTIRRFWPALVAALALTCCIEDKLDTSDPATEWCAGEADYVLCLNLQSVGETAGRAESNASSEEVTIGRTGNYILLFDKDKRLISVEPLVLSQGDGYFDEAHPKDPNNSEDPDLEKTPGTEHYEDVYMATKIRVREQQQVPAWCLVLVNAQEVYSSYLSKLKKGDSMADVLAYPLNTINDPYRIGYTPIGDETPGTAEPSRFLMTNSSYVDENGDVVTAVPIDKEKHLIRIENAISDAEIDKEIDEQLTEKKKFPVVAHVEPLVAKFSLEFKSSYPDDVAGGYVYYPHATTNTRNAGDQITKNLDLFVGFDENGIPQTKEVLWRVVVTGWNINAQETQTKIFKNIPEQESRPKWNNWTDFRNFRSYWAEDPHYGKESSYPWQYRTAIDYIPGEGQDPMPTNYAEGETKDSNLLKNYSFNDLNVQYLSPSRAVYVPENTYDYFKGYDAAGFKRAYDNRGHVLAGTHVIVCAKLQISKDGGSTWQTFSGYRDRAGRYYLEDDKDKCFIRMMRTFNYYLNSQSEMRYVYYEWEENPYGDEAREGDIYYARPSSGGHVNDDDDDDDDNDEPKHQYEVYLDGIRMFDEDETQNPGMSEYGFWNYAKFNEYPHQYLSRGGEEYMLPADVKNGDGKAIPWLRAKKDGESRLKILDVNNPDEVTTGNRIPVYEYNQESIDYAVNLFVSSRTFGKKENGEDYTKKEIEVKRAILREDFRDWLLGAETTSQFDRDVIIKCRDSLVKDANIPPYVQAILCGEPLKQRSIADNDRRSLFYDWLNALDHFKDGRMYYAAKVANADVNPNNTDEDSVPYGTVRNSWYQYTLTGIRHVGTPVDQLDDPIVPQSVLTFDQIHVKVHILGWHTVEMNVTLPD